MRNAFGLNRFVFFTRLFFLGFGISANALVGNVSFDSIVSGLDTDSQLNVSHFNYLDSRPDTFSTNSESSDWLPYRGSLLPETEEEEARSFGETFDIEVLVDASDSSLFFGLQPTVLQAEILFKSESDASGFPLSGCSRLVLFQIFRI
ncbi:MAG: hypothetical protein RLZZ241_1071 [Bacteroidota bacterium]